MQLGNVRALFGKARVLLGSSVFANNSQKKTMNTSLHKAIRKYKVCFRENKAAFRQQCVDKQFMNTCLHDAI